MLSYRYLGYARDGDYLPLLGHIAKATLQGVVPFVWICDFNTHPEVLEADPAVAAMEAVVLRPSGGAVSCHQGTGTLIDCAVVSKKVLPLVELSLVREVPWGPHDGLKLRIKKNVREVLARRMVRPLPFDHPSLQATAGEPWDMPWTEAKQEAERELRDVQLATSETLKDQRELMNDIGVLEESITLGRQLMHWSRAVEHQALASRGIDPRGGHADTAKGRSMPVRFIDTL